MAGLDVRASVTPAWRDAAGRFARADAGGVLARTVQSWGGAAVRELRDATPVRTGAARAAWRADYRPSVRAVAVSNQKPYVPYLFTGTRPHNIPRAFGYALPFGTRGRFGGRFHPGTAPNPALAAALERISRQAAQMGAVAYAAIMQRLGGGG